MTEPAFTALPDLAARALGAGVVYANDEFFAERENLIKGGPAQFSPATFGHRGQIYDGWETRRRRVDGHDEAVIRLGAAGIVRGVVIDTAWFTGNFPPFASVEATGCEGYPSPAELRQAEWEPLVERSELRGDTRNCFGVSASRRYTHVRLSIYPDGGVARLRVHGEVVADPRLLSDSVDLAALENGGTVLDCSNRFYSSPGNLIMPGRARTMGEGWETARRRDSGNDWVEFALAAPGRIDLAELDTSHFVGNAPGEVALTGRDRRADPDRWFELLPRQRVQPDTPHRLRVASGPEVTDVRLDVYPDGGLARVRLIGALSAQTRDELMLGWFNSLPSAQAGALLSGRLGPDDAAALIAARPLADVALLPAGVSG